MHNRNKDSQIFAKWYIVRRQVISDLNERAILRERRKHEWQDLEATNAARDTRQRPRLLQRSLVGRERKANKVTTIKLTTQISRFTAHWLTLSQTPRAQVSLLPPTIYQQCIQVGYKYAWIMRYANSYSFGRACPEGIVCRCIAVFLARSFRGKI